MLRKKLVALRKTKAVNMSFFIEYESIWVFEWCNRSVKVLAASHAKKIGGGYTQNVSQPSIIINLYFKKKKNPGQKKDCTLCIIEFYHLDNPRKFTLEEASSFSSYKEYTQMETPVLQSGTTISHSISITIPFVCCIFATFYMRAYFI